MKTPKELDKIYNRLPKDKTELAKVELGIVDDIAQAISNLENQFKQLSDAERKQFNAVVEIRKSISEAKKIDNKSKSLANKSESIADKSAKLITKARQAAKDLGVKDSDIKGLKQLFNTIDNMDQKIEEIRNFQFTYEKL